MPMDFGNPRSQKRRLTRSGNTEAFSSNFHIVPEEKFAVIILTNQSGEMDICTLNEGIGRGGACLCCGFK